MGRGRLIVAMVLVLGALALVQINPVVRAAESAAGRIAVTAGAVYISLRAINAALSVAQDIEVGGSLGVSANLQPLKVLEPVDDTVERVSDAIFLVAVGAALFAVAFGPMAVFGGGLALVGLGMMLVHRGAGRRAAIMGMMLALALPAVFWGSATLAQWLTGAALAEAQAELTAVSDQAGILIGQTAPERAPDALRRPVDEGFLDRMRGMASTASDGVGSALETASQYYNSAAYFMENADVILRASLQVIGLLLLQTLILPLAILSVLWIVARPMLHRGNFATQRP